MHRSELIAVKWAMSGEFTILFSVDPLHKVPLSTNPHCIGSTNQVMASISAGLFLPAEIGEVATLVVGSYIYVPTTGVDCLGGLSIWKVADWDSML